MEMLINGVQHVADITRTSHVHTVVRRTGNYALRNDQTGGRITGKPDNSVSIRDARFGSKVGQIGTKWDKSWAFSDQMSVHLAPPLETDL